MLLKFSFVYSNIIYDKNEITITDIEINKYIKIYQNSYGDNLTINKALKDIVLMKKTVNFLDKNNPEYMLILNEKINLEFGEDTYKDEILYNFLRFQKIRNEFISEYFQNVFSVGDLENIFLSINELNYQ